MNRRAFIAGLGGAATWPIAATAQQPAKLPTIGFFGPVAASIDNRQISAFLERLRKLGWIEGRTVVMEYRWAEGRGSTCRYCRRASQAEGRCHCYVFNCDRHRVKARDIDHPNRLCFCD